MFTSKSLLFATLSTLKKSSSPTFFMCFLEMYYDSRLALASEYLTKVLRCLDVLVLALSSM